MSSDKPFRKIDELVAGLAEAQQGMGSGSVDLARLETACDDARELYERLVVLRHKAREAAVGQGTTKAPEVPPVKAGSSVVSDTKPVRLDTRPVELSTRQTSLIEAIESTEMDQPTAVLEPAATEASKPSQPAQGGAKPPTLAERHERSAVTDLGKGISLSHKFWFVAELFNGDRVLYEKSIERLNSFANLQEAEAFVRSEVIEKLKKPADPEAITTFTDLVQRRYA